MAADLKSPWDVLTFVCAGIGVCSLWVWMAVRTMQCLRLTTRAAIPFSLQAVWISKAISLLAGAGAVSLMLVEGGVAWYFGIVPTAVIAWFSLRETVTSVVPQKPVQTSTAHDAAWLEYRRLRRSYRRSLWIIALPVLGAVAVGFVPDCASASTWTLFKVLLLALLCACTVIVGFRLQRVRYWPCPRCGCAFGGRWGDSKLPSQCAFCGLPRREESNLSGRPAEPQEAADSSVTTSL